MGKANSSQGFRIHLRFTRADSAGLYAMLQSLPPYRRAKALRSLALAAWRGKMITAPRQQNATRPTADAAVSCEAAGEADFIAEMETLMSNKGLTQLLSR